MIVKIKDEEITLKYSFRSLIVFEEITGKSLDSLTSLKDILIFFFSVVLSCSKNIDITWDDFIDWLDDNPDEAVNFVQWFKSVSEAQSFVTEKRVEEIGKKAKKTAGKSKSKN